MAEPGQPILAASSVSKAYGSVKALDRVDAAIFPGEVHAVLGENGAGKSTLMSILAGFTVPDEGTVTVRGSLLPCGQPGEVRRMGIALVHQHFMLAPQFTGLENLVLDQMGSRKGFAAAREVESRTKAILDQLGWSLDLSLPVNRIPVGAQQRLEIVKTLLSGSEIIILDEPTAVLSPDEVLDLARVLKKLKGEGRTIILIAHKLSEVYAMADRVTVLRKGKLIGTSPLASLAEDALAEWMVGEVPAMISSGRTESEGRVLLSARGLIVKGDRGEPSVRGASLDLHAGEILGIGGVDGNGQVELAEAIAGLRSLEGGSLQSASLPSYIPQDRQVDGLALDMPIWENMLIAGIEQPTLRPRPFLLRAKALDWAKALISQYSIKATSPHQTARSLSGGNQQKVVVSRALSSEPEIVVAVNPTRGLDIRASQFVHFQLVRAAQRGAGVLLFSTDLDELAALAHRTFLMSSGNLVQGGSAAYLGGG